LRLDRAQGPHRLDVQVDRTTPDPVATRVLMMTAEPRQQRTKAA
jgi:hypothetical protein